MMDFPKFTNRRRITIAVFSACLTIATGMSRQMSRSAQTQPHRSGALRVTVEDGAEIGIYDESHALVIGAINYNQPDWVTLPGAAKDVAEVSSALEEQGFSVERLINPTRAILDQSVWKFIGTYGQARNNRLVIYFVGHGATIKTEDGRDLGYIVPTDAPSLEEGKAAFKQGAISMELFKLYAQQIESRHALFVFDSCFSGSMFHETMRSVPNYIISRMAEPVRQFITAGTEDQKVPDESIFREQFVKALQGEADLNSDKYVTGTELGLFLQDRIAEYTHGKLMPQWGKISDPELNRGDFLFSVVAAGQPSGPALTPADLSTISKAINPAELSYWIRIANSTDPDDYKAFLAKYPHGTFAPVAELRSTERGQLRSPRPAATPREDESFDAMLVPAGFQRVIQDPKPSNRTNAHPDDSWYVILGSFGLSHQDKANLVMLKYQALGYDARLINSNWGDFPNFARSLWVIVIGPDSQPGARALAREIRAKAGGKPYYKQATK